ncbi:MAG: hypothetical protein ACRDTZ_17645 [Pseudonocardiaceae bacterium]
MVNVLRVPIDDTDLIKAACEALERPSHFGYWGDLDLFRSWGLTVVQHRDSDAVDRSNYRCVLRDLTDLVERRGCDVEDYVDEVACNDWAHGWVDHIAVRVLIDVDGEVVPGNITGAFRWVAYVREHYAVYDESDHSELELDEGLEIVEGTLADVRNDAENAVADEDEGARLVPEWITAEDVLRRLHDNGVETPRENHCRYDDTESAVWQLADEGDRS